MIPFGDSDIHLRTVPVINRFLIALSLLVFLYELWVGGLGVLFGRGSLGLQVFFFQWGFIPQELSQGQAFTVLDAGFTTLNIETPVPTWATILSAMFIHGGVMHLGGNMVFLWVFGNNIEDRMGHLLYLLFYLAAGVAATLAHFALDPGSTTPLVGASGAISGVMGAYLLFYPYNRVKALIIFFLITAVELPAVILLGMWFLWQLVQAFWSLGASSQVTSVAFGAHVGGFLAGMAVVALYKMLTGQPVWPPRGGPPYGGGVRYWRGRPID